MASIGSVDFKLSIAKGMAGIDVSYDVTFAEGDKGEDFVEVCRIIGDDTDVGDPIEAGDDDPLAYLAPLFYRRIRVGQARTVPRKLHANVPVSMLDEDYGPIAGADELRALVTLIPAPKRMTFRESNLVSKP
jgi:hypothetical protein